MDSIAQFVGQLPGSSTQVGLVAFSVMALIILKIIKETKEMLAKPTTESKDVHCSTHSQQIANIAELCTEIRNLNEVLRDLKESIRDNFSESWKRLRDVETRMAVVETKVDSHG